MTTVTIFQNKLNENKYIEVHNDGYFHNSVRQYMYWPKANVKNLLGDRCLHRWKINNLKLLLQDYNQIKGIS